MLIKSQSEVRLHTGRSVHFTPADVPDNPFRFFEGLVPRLGVADPCRLANLLYSRELIGLHTKRGSDLTKHSLFQNTHT